MHKSSRGCELSVLSGKCRGAEWLHRVLPETLLHRVPRWTDCTCIAGHGYKHLCTSLAWNTVWQGLAETRSTHHHPTAMPSKRHRVIAGLGIWKGGLETALAFQSRPLPPVVWDTELRGDCVQGMGSSLWTRGLHQQSEWRG